MMKAARGITRVVFIEEIQKTKPNINRVDREGKDWNMPLKCFLEYI